MVFKIADKTVTAAELAYNGYLVIKGKADLAEKEWHAQTEGDQFFKAELTVTNPGM